MKDPPLGVVKQKDFAITILVIARSSLFRGNVPVGFDDDKAAVSRCVTGADISPSLRVCDLGHKRIGDEISGTLGR